MYMQHNKLIYFYNIQNLSAAIREREREDSLVDQPKIIKFNSYSDNFSVFYF